MIRHEIGVAVKNIKVTPSLSFQDGEKHLYPSQKTLKYWWRNNINITTVRSKTHRLVALQFGHPTYRSLVTPENGIGNVKAYSSIRKALKCLNSWMFIARVWSVSGLSKCRTVTHLSYCWNCIVRYTSNDVVLEVHVLRQRGLCISCKS